MSESCKGDVRTASRSGYARLLIAASIGSAFELYDFTLFAFFAASIAPAFFPTGDPTTSLLMTAATFGIGALMRPIGAIILGIYADKISRKAVLSLTFLLMAVGSVVIGITPSYPTIGLWAPIIVVAARMVQGFSAGGELGSVSAFVAEQVPAARRGYYLGYISTASLGSTLISAAIGLSLGHILGPVVMADWGWRLPFLFGAIIAPIGFYVRAKLPESDLFIERKAEAERDAGAVLTPKIGKGKLLLIMAGFIPGTAVNYLSLIYMPTYLHKQMNVDLSIAFEATLVAAALVAILMPFIGLLSDILGRRQPLIVGNLMLLLISYPFYLWLQAAPNLGVILVAQCVFMIILALVTAPMVPLAAELFPTIGRSTGMSLGMAMPLAIFGTCAPMIVTWLILATGYSLAPAFYLMGTALLGVIAVSLLPQPQKTL